MIAFHRFLIGTAICFCVGFAGWSFAGYLTQGGAGLLALAAAFACASGLLGYYLKNLDRFLHR
jgi:hypothetical protein